MDKSGIIEAFQELEAFKASLSPKQLAEEIQQFQLAEITALHYYSVTKDYIKFDKIVDISEKQHLYSSEILPVIYEVYMERKLHLVAFDHLNKAITFYKQQELEVPVAILEIHKKYPDEETIKDLKAMMANLSSQRPTDIPKIIPNNINDQNILDDFILNEIIQASRAMLEKIFSIQQITHENKYNDLLISLLRLRLPIWGWHIHDEPRVESSNAKKDSGKADFLIQSGGNSIALWEAFILDDTAYTQNHILRCKNYVSSLDRYYMIIYHLSPKTTIDDHWAKYQKDVLNVDYPSEILIDKVKGFQDLKGFTNIQHLRLAKTFHSESIEMFHIMINIGPSPTPPERKGKNVSSKTKAKQKPKTATRKIAKKKSSNLKQNK